MRQARLAIAALLVVGGCAYVGFTDLADALRAGASTRNALETLAIGGVLAAIVVVVALRESRRTRIVDRMRRPRS